MRHKLLTSTVVGLLLTVPANATLDLLKRSETGAPLTQAQFDSNYTLIETEVNDTELQAIRNLTGDGFLKRSGTSITASVAGMVLVDQMDCVPSATLNATPGTLPGTSTPNEQSFQHWQFVDGSDTHLDCAGRFPSWWTAGTVNVRYCVTNTAASNNVVVDAAIRNLAEDIDTTAHTYSYTSGTLAMSATIGTPACGSISLTGASLDGLSGGGFFNLRIRRDGDGASDTSTGIAQLIERSIVLEAG